LTRVLFVDDEPRALSRLPAMFRDQQDWEVLVAQGGEAALDYADQVPLDAVVSAMKMPGMDGAALLAEMRRRHPGVARIVWSDRTEQNDAMRCVSVVHQSLVKFCDPALLVTAVRRACDLQARLQSTELREALGRVESLPSPPAVVLELSSLLQRDDVDIDEVDSLISTDVGMSAKVLQLVNSAFFGLAQKITRVHDALAYLGLNLVHDLVVSEEVFRSAEDACALSQGMIERVRAHSMAVSAAAADLAPDRRLSQQAFIAGLLHDIGWLVLAAQAPDRLEMVAAGARERRPLEEVEREVLGASHADAGAYLLSLWGLPTSIVEGVAHHHDAQLMAHRELDLPHVVHLADLIASDNGDGLPELEVAPALPEQRYLCELGVVERLAAALLSLDCSPPAQA
jgi:HD-like signal output (HDOD) protein/CheY-like chemotaxis protein